MEKDALTDTNLSEESTGDVSPSGTASRPTTLNILLDNGLRNPLLSTFRTPSLSDLQPLLKSEVEKLLQQWKASPQTPGTFLNPKHVTDEQERFANAFTQKLNELRDPDCLASLTAALSPANAAAGNMYNINLPELNAQNIPDIAELCRRAVQQPGIANQPILLYSPAALNSQSIGEVQTKIPSMGNVQSASSNQISSGDSSTIQNQAPGSLSITVPNTSSSSTTLQLPSGLKFEITADGGISQASLLKLLGLDAQVSETSQISNNEGISQNLDSLLWPLRLQTTTSSDAQLESLHNPLLTSPRGENDTRPSSVANSLDQAEINHPIRSSSSISSNSSNSQCNENPSGSNNADTRLDPSEQYRMRLERKRARNRDAARKCRERKIRLIKSLEKDVSHLSTENQALQRRLAKSKLEVDRLKHFVVNHLEKECTAISNKVA